MNKKILAAIAIAVSIWCGGVISGAYCQHKRVMETLQEIAVLKCKIEVLQDSDLKTRINVGHLQSDVKKLKQGNK